MPRQEDSAYTITWASGLFTITWAATYAPVSFSSAEYTVVNYAGNTYFGIGSDQYSLTTLNWTSCTSPAAAGSRAGLISAIAALVTSTGSSVGAFDTITTFTPGNDLNIVTGFPNDAAIIADTNVQAYGFQVTNGGNTNTTYGYQAGPASVGGTYNCAFGYQSLLNNGSGQGNMAIGFHSLQSSTSGSNCIGIGNSALQNYTLNDTVAIGSGALQNCSTGTGNTAVGAADLQTVTTGSNNTAIGWLSGQLQPSTGSNNTLIGSNAHLNSDLSQCTLIGSAVASSAAANTVIGYNSSATATDATVLGAAIASTTAHEVVIANSTQTVIRPDSDNACDIGTSSKRTKNVYVGTGVVFNNGTLTYDPTNQAQSFIGPFTSSQPVTLRVSIVGKRVTVTFPPLSAAASVALSISTSGALPVAYRPSERISQYIFVKNNGSFVQGLVSIETTGIINVGNTGTNPGSPAAFTASGTAGWEGFSVCYNIA
jgi:hypothetical protein